MSEEIKSLPYEKYAQHGADMPSGLDFVDQTMFQALAHLYARYYDNAITREKAAAEKKALLREYRHNKFLWGIVDHSTEVTKRTELARAEYRKNRTLENADKLCAAIDGIPRREPDGD